MPGFLCRSLRLTGVVVCALLCAGVTAGAQDVTKEKQTALLLSAREMYYNLRLAGVESYTCRVEFDWDGFFTAVAGKPLAPDDPSMMYLNRLKVRLKSDLNGQADVTFIEASPAPAERQAGLKKLEGSLKEMLDGFVQAWVPTLNGTMIPDAPLSMKKTPGGYLLKDAAGDGSEETLDDGLHLTSLVVKSEAMSSTMRTTFTPSPQGLLMTEMEGTYSEPASAPPTAVSMKAGFAAVDGFELPSSLVVTVPNVASFHFAFSGCTVQKRSGAGTKR